MKPGAHESITPGDTATGITAAVITPTGATDEFFKKHAIAALITVEDNSMRFTQDGTTATAAIGHKMDAGQSYLLPDGHAVTKFQAIDAVSGSASVIHITTFFR